MQTNATGRDTHERCDRPREATAQPASIVAGLTGHDLITRKAYARRVAPLCEPCGGEILGASVPSLAVVEGSWKPALVVVQRWPSKVQCHACVASEASQPLHTLRHQAATAGFLLVEGWR
jgi:uncharacterized protein (DUF1330 family)